MKKLSAIFLVSLILNVLWENLHVFLYDSYMGGKITELILLRASLFDAVVITAVSLPFIYFDFFKKRPWLIIVIGIIVAILNEWYGLGSSRWAYNAYMPVIPLIDVGLTPVIQLGLIGFMSLKICSIKK